MDFSEAAAAAVHTDCVLITFNGFFLGEACEDCQHVCIIFYPVL